MEERDIAPLIYLVILIGMIGWVFSLGETDPGYCTKHRRPRRWMWFGDRKIQVCDECDWEMIVKEEKQEQAKNTQ